MPKLKNHPVFVLNNFSIIQNYKNRKKKRRRLDLTNKKQLMTTCSSSPPPETYYFYYNNNGLNSDEQNSSDNEILAPSSNSHYREPSIQNSTHPNNSDQNKHINNVPPGFKTPLIIEFFYIISSISVSGESIRGMFYKL